VINNQCGAIAPKSTVRRQKKADGENGLRNSKHQIQTFIKKEWLEEPLG
jgi:hypothetical protein